MTKCDGPNFRNDHITEGKFLSNLDRLATSGLMSKEVIFNIKYQYFVEKKIKADAAAKEEADRQAAVEGLFKFANSKKP